MPDKFQVEIADPSARRVIIAANPHSGAFDRRSLIEQLVEQLESKNFDVEILGEIDRICQTASQSLANGTLRAVVAAGGDGTAALLANRLPSAVPLVVFPLGTANLLAKYLTIRRNVNQITDIIEDGQTVRLDAGMANGQFFLVVTSCGFDAEVVRKLHKSRKGHISYLSYITPILRAFWKYNYPTLEITFDNGQRMGSVRWAFIQNIPRYAMNLSIVDGANPFDGKLDCCTFRSGGILASFYYFLCCLFRRQSRIKTARFVQFKSMTITTEGAGHYQIDGDPGGRLPLTIEVVPERFRVMVPKEWVQSQMEKMNLKVDEKGEFRESPE